MLIRLTVFLKGQPEHRMGIFKDPDVAEASG